MRALVLVVVALASCVGPTAPKGDRLLAGIDRRASGSAMIGAGTSAGAVAAVLTVNAVRQNEVTSAPLRDSRAADAAMVIVPIALVSTALIAAGAFAYASGHDLVVSVFDEVESDGAAAADEAVEERDRAEQARKPVPLVDRQTECKPGWDCPAVD